MPITTISAGAPPYGERATDRHPRRGRACRVGWPHRRRAAQLERGAHAIRARFAHAGQSRELARRGARQRTDAAVLLDQIRSDRASAVFSHREAARAGLRHRAFVPCARRQQTVRQRFARVNLRSCAAVCPPAGLCPAGIRTDKCYRPAMFVCSECGAAGPAPGICPADGTEMVSIGEGSLRPNDRCVPGRPLARYRRHGARVQRRASGHRKSRRDQGAVARVQRSP